jgi:endonuclease/exonuclease/phosphatase family metal-dependent hydrolase
MVARDKCGARGCFASLLRRECGAAIWRSRTSVLISVVLGGSRQRRGWALGFALWAMPASALAEPHSGARDGRFDVVTYNVAGLPEGLSKVRPLANLPLIGAQLNKFDLALVQEDFAYPELLRERLLLPYRSAAFVRGKELHFGDGLSLFSRLPIGDVARSPWAACHGVVDAYFDCLTPKGFASSRVELSPGVFIDTYNVHFDAGGSEPDVRARQAQVRQLTEAIRSSSEGHAVILAGDFNLTLRELPGFKQAMSSIGLLDTCEEVRCGQALRLDRILFRNNDQLRLTPRAWRLAAGFRDARGRPLSDHDPVAVTFRWQTPSPLAAPP